MCETAAGKTEQSRGESVGISCKEAGPGWFSLKAYLWMKVYSGPGVHSHRETRPVIKGARGQDGPLI